MKQQNAAALTAVLLPASVTANAASNGAMTVHGNLERSHGDWRGSKLAGAAVHDSQGDRIGTIGDMVPGFNDKVSSGGFPGVGAKVLRGASEQAEVQPTPTRSRARGSMKW